MSVFDQMITEYRSELMEQVVPFAEEYERMDESDRNESFPLRITAVYNTITDRFLVKWRPAKRRHTLRGVAVGGAGFLAGVLLGAVLQSALVGTVVVLFGFILTWALSASLPDLEKEKSKADAMLREQVKATIIERHEQRVRKAEDDRLAAAQELEAFVAPARASLAEWQSRFAPPAPQPYGVSPAGAEVWVRDWMVFMGAEHAATTQFVGDGGVDVEDAHYIAQVKHYTGAVGIAEIREHIGVAAVDQASRTPLFFTSGNYPASVIETADRASMALFVYRVETGEVHAANVDAEIYLSVGLNPAWRKDTGTE